MILSNDLMSKMVDAGLIPETAIKVVIELAVSEPMRVHCQCWGSEKILNVVTPTALKDCATVDIDDSEALLGGLIADHASAVTMQDPSMFEDREFTDKAMHFDIDKAGLRKGTGPQIMGETT